MLQETIKRIVIKVYTVVAEKSVKLLRIYSIDSSVELHKTGKNNVVFYWIFVGESMRINEYVTDFKDY